MAGRQATAQQILEIRAQAEAGVLRPKLWADAIGCSVETVRRYARGDSARHLTGQRWGEAGLPAGTNEPGTYAGEPNASELAASLERLNAAIKVPAARRVDDLLDELTRKGKSND